MQCDCLRFTVRLPTNVSLGVRCRQVSLESCVGPVRCLIIFGQGLFLNLSLVDEEEFHPVHQEGFLKRQAQPQS